MVQEYGVVELYIDRGEALENKRIFDQLHNHKDEIEKAFGDSLLWERLDAKRACRIKRRIETAGYRSPESEWPKLQSEMVESMSKLETALKPSLTSLDLHGS